MKRVRQLLPGAIADICFNAAADLGLSIDMWAERANLHPTTILRLASGDTRYPRFQTVTAMAAAVGIEFSMLRSNKNVPV